MPGGGGLDLGNLLNLTDQLLPGAAQLLSTGTEAINGRYGDLGGVTGPLGQAIGVPNLTPDGNGVVQLFQRGMLLFSEQTGAHALVGAGLADYLAGGGQPVRGFPDADSLR